MEQYPATPPNHFLSVILPYFYTHQQGDYTNDIVNNQCINELFAFIFKRT